MHSERRSKPSIFYPEEEDAQSIRFEGHRISLLYDGPLPFINVRRPTKQEWKDCPHFDMTSREEWDPYSSASCISHIETHTDMSGEFAELFDLRDIRSFFYTYDKEDI